MKPNLLILSLTTLILLLAACSQPAPTSAPNVDSPSVSPQVVGDYVVNSLSDPGDGTCDASNCTLREAINAAAAGNTISFSVNGTILLGSTLVIPFGKNLTIDATGQSIILNGQGTVQVLWNQGATLTLTNLTITKGYFSNSGGGIYNYAGNLTLNNSTVSGNSAIIYGGGIFNYAGNLTLNNSTVSGNTAVAGGGIVNEGSTLILNNSTVSGNSANKGGGIANIYGLFTLKNSIIANSTGGDCAFFNGSSSTDQGYNLVEDSSNACGLTNGVNGNIVGVDPKLGPLQNNGGLTLTHALASDSPTLDQIPPANCGTTTDQRGITRPQGSACDIGAFELEVVSDTTAPTASPSFSGTVGTNGWYKSDLTVTWNWSDSGSGIDPANCTTSSTSSGEGTGIVISAACKDKAGNTTPALLVIKVDKTAPTLNPNISPNTIPVGATATVSANASDSISGIASQSCDALDTTTPGPKSLTCTATDKAGNTTTVSVSYTVSPVYNFSGFLQPVDNLPTINQVKAGASIPVKFSLAGNQGLNIFAAGSPSSQSISCSTSTSVDDIEQTVTAGSSSLSYDATTDTYTYVWKTEKSWAGTCRQLNVKLSDGMTYKAAFKFR